LKKDDMLRLLFLIVSVIFLMEHGHKTNFGFKISIKDLDLIYQLAEFVYFCWRCSSNALKQHNQATILLGSSIRIPYFLLALTAMNISTMEWRSFLAA